VNNGRCANDRTCFPTPAPFVVGVRRDGTAVCALNQIDQLFVGGMPALRSLFTGRTIPRTLEILGKKTSKLERVVLVVGAMSGGRRTKTSKHAVEARPHHK